MRMLNLQLLLIFFLLGLPATEAAGQKTIALVVDAPLAAPAAHGVADLEKALTKRGLQPLRQRSLADPGPPAIIVGIAGSSPAVDRVLAEQRIDLSKKAESLC